MKLAGGSSLMEEGLAIVKDTGVMIVVRLYLCYRVRAISEAAIGSLLAPRCSGQ